MVKYILLFSFVIMILISPFVTCLASEFECAFIQEKYKGGASNKSECVSNPQAMKMWATPKKIPAKWEHCKNDEVYGYCDRIDFYINESRVSWKSKCGLTDYAKQSQKENFLTMGYSEREAQEKADLMARIIEGRKEFPVKHHYIGEESIIWDSKKEKLTLDKAPKGKCHIFIFGDNEHKHSLYIAHNNKAILSTYVAVAEISVVVFNFGECKGINE